MDGSEITQEAVEINGFTIEEFASKQHFSTLVENFLSWADAIEDKTLAGQNVFFDREFLVTNMKRAGLYVPAWLEKYRVVDLHSVCYARLLSRDKTPELINGCGVSAMSLDKILEYVALPKRQGKHNALEDAKLEAEALSRLIYGTNLLEEFSQFPIPLYLAR